MLAGGAEILGVLTALQESQRLNQCRAAASARARLSGRPKKLADLKKLAQQLYEAGQTDIATICQTLGISRATLYRDIAPRVQFTERDAD